MSKTSPTHWLNLGPKSARWLAAIGVKNRTDLKRRGAVPTFVRLKQEQKGVSLNLLYALVGAVEGCDWREVKRIRKLELVFQVEDYERAHPSKVASIRPVPLLGAPNIGPTIAKKLAMVGVRTMEDLRRLGPAKAYRKMVSLNQTESLPACYYLYSLQGALDGRHWNEIGATEKRRLRTEAGLGTRGI